MDRAATLTERHAPASFRGRRFAGDPDLGERSEARDWRVAASEGLPKEAIPKTGSTAGLMIPLLSQQGG